MRGKIFFAFILLWHYYNPRKGICLAEFFIKYAVFFTIFSVRESNRWTSGRRRGIIMMRLPFMTKQDYYAKYTFFDPSLPYNVHWWYNRTTDYHRHMDFYELFLPLEGGLIQYYNDQCMTLEPHTLYIIPKMQYHRIDYIRQEGNANIFNMSVSESFFEHNIATYSSSLMEAIKGKDCLYVRLEQVSYEFLLMLSRKATYDKDANQRLQATRLFLTAAATLYQACEMNDDALSQPRRYALDIKTKIDNLEYIENDVASIYEHYPLAPSLLIRNFKDLTGKTIIKYQVERRMKYACALLTNTDYTILRISSMVGYDSLSHFTENFRKFYGTTPAAYRKELSAHLRGAAEEKNENK